MKYKHFSIAEREFLKESLLLGRSLRDIAKDLKRSPSSLAREFKRNGRSGYYSPYKANERAVTKRMSRGREKRLKNDRIRRYVITHLKLGWSPEQISGRLYLDTRQKISHEAIYQYIYHQIHRDGWGNVKPSKEDLRIYLKRRHKRRVKKGMRSSHKFGKIQGKSIDLRPQVVQLRKRFGDWEGDSMVSHNSKAKLNTLVERKSGFVFITKLTDGSAHETAKTVCERMSHLPPRLRRTLTLDNGHENANNVSIEKNLGIDCYLAHAYHSWERGTNENTNGLIRWYLPKKSDFANVTKEEISAVEYALNTRPRKRLGWKTPQEVFNKSVALES